MCIDPTNSTLFIPIYGGSGGIRAVKISDWSSTTITTAGTSPIGVCIDSTGTNLYIANAINPNSISKYTIATNTLTTIAGGTSTGYVEGLGTSARFDRPAQIVIDSTNSYLYVCDGNNKTIRRVELISGQGGVVSISGLNGSPVGSSTNSYYSGLVYHPYEQCVYYNHVTLNAIIKIINTPKTTQIQNATGRQVTITVPNATVSNSNLRSVEGISDVKTLYSTSGINYTLL
jgi:DNA-binding beta-propeller fold protein YncE